MKPNDYRIRILGVPVSIVNMRSAVTTILKRTRDDCASFVFVREVPSLIATIEDERLVALHEEALLVVPDGMPLVWAARLRGINDQIGRVSGADLMVSLCEASVEVGKTHYFFGGQPGVAEQVADAMRARFPGLKVAGTYTPPFRNIAPGYDLDEEARAELQEIRAAAPDFIWVGISSPKQEVWMSVAAPHLAHGVLIGVGAAFDFHSGRVKRAPLWMQRSGLEWLHRLASEPRRLWRRYLVAGSKYVLLFTAEQLRFTRSRSFRQGT